MTVAHMKPLQVYLRPDQLEALRALAKQRELSVGELVREGVDRILAEVPPEEDPLWTIGGLFASGLNDLSLRHDDYLAQYIEEDSSR